MEIEDVKKRLHEFIETSLDDTFTMSGEEVLSIIDVLDPAIADMPDVPLKAITAAEGLACDAAIGNGEPEQFAEHCVRLVAGMTDYTLAEVRAMPDGVVQKLWERCHAKREKDQSDAVKNFGTPDSQPSVSVVSSGVPTSTSSSAKSANGSSSNGASTSDSRTETQPIAAEAALALKDEEGLT